LEKAQHTVESESILSANEFSNENFENQKPLLIQPKLSVGAVDDPFEREADAMADRVMRMPDSSFIQRKCASCEEEEKINRMAEPSFLQRKCAGCEHEEEQIHRKITPFIQEKGNGLGGGMASESVTNQINASRGGGSKMSENTLNFMESRFGSDFSGVKIHTDTNAVQMSRELNAQAFTVGSDIYFNQGKYSPESASGKHLLAHELTHTVQQGGGVERKIQKFDSPEHVAVGNAGGQSVSGYILLLLHTRDLPNRTSPVSLWSPDMQELFNNGTPQQKRFMQSGLSYGEIVALSGDFYGTANQLYIAPIREVYTLLPLISGHATTQQLEAATGGRYMTLAERNDSHFSITASGRPNNIQTWKQRHIQALIQAMSGNLNMAYMINASADHYLTDRFASGHILTARTDFSTTGGLYALLNHDIDNEYGVNVTNLRGDSWVAYGDEMWDSDQNAQNRIYATEAVQVSARDVAIYGLYNSPSFPRPTQSTQFEAERIIPQLSTASQRVSHTFGRLSTALSRRANGYINGAVEEVFDNIESGMRTFSNITSRIGRAISLVILDARNTCFPGNWTYHYMPERGRAHLNVLGFVLSSISLNGNIGNLLTSLTSPLSSFNMDAQLVELAADITSALVAKGVNITVLPAEIRGLTLLRLVELLNLSGLIFYNRPPHDLSIEQLRELS
jgi:ribosomal protein S27E